MADTKLNDLASGAPAAGTDIIYAVKDLAGTLVDRQLSLENVKDYILGLANTWTANQTLGSSVELLWSTDLRLTRRGAANLRLGAADTTGTTAPTPQFLSAQSWASSTNNNQTGANFTIDGSQGTGTGAGGSIIFRVAPAGPTSNGVQNALATFLEATSARAFNLYNTTDVTTNFERGKIAWESNVLRIGTVKGGTGTARALEFQTDGTTRMTISAGGMTSLAGSEVSSFDFSLRNTSDSATAQTRIKFDNNTTPSASTGGVIFYTSSTYSLFPANSFGFWNQTSNGIIAFSTNDTERVSVRANGLFAFGAIGTAAASSFPALKRSSTTLQVRLADDSADAGLQCAALTVTGNLTISTKNIVTDTTTGTKIGTGTTQKIGFYNATPVVQPTAVADATDAATVITQLNALLSRMRNLGLIAT